MFLSPFTSIPELMRVISSYNEMLLLFAISWIVIAAILNFIVYKIVWKKGRIYFIGFTLLAVLVSFFLTYYPLVIANTFTPHKERAYASAKVIRHYSGIYGKGLLRLLEYKYYGINLSPYDYPPEHARKWEMTEGWGKSLRMKVSKEEYEFIKDGAVLTFSYRLGRYFPFDVRFEQRPATQELPLENQVIFEEVETPVESSNLQQKTATPTGIKVD